MCTRKTCAGFKSPSVSLCFNFALLVLYLVSVSLFLYLSFLVCLPVGLSAPPCSRGTTAFHSTVPGTISSRQLLLDIFYKYGA